LLADPRGAARDVPGASMGEIEQGDLLALWAELEAMPIAYHPLHVGARDRCGGRVAAV
jgi:hypothetical protein